MGNMTKDEFCYHMRAMLNTQGGDPYVIGNLRRSLEHYQNETVPVPRKPMFVEKLGCCYHDIPFSEVCDQCMESYGEARPTSL